MNVDDFIAEAPLPVQHLLKEALDLLMRQHPGLTARMRYRIPFVDYHRMLFFLHPRKNHIAIGFCNGAVLSDEAGILTAGDRKYIRHYPVYHPSDLYLPALQPLLQEAILMQEISLRTKNGR